MENLKRIIGPAPSEISREELIMKIRKRQEFVGALLQAFRNQASAPVKGKKEKKVRSKSDTAAFGDLARELKELGITMEEFKEIARGEGK